LRIPCSAIVKRWKIPTRSASFEVALSALDGCKTLENTNPKRERGSQEYTAMLFCNPLPHLRFGLVWTGRAQLQKAQARQRVAEKRNRVGSRSSLALRVSILLRFPLSTAKSATSKSASGRVIELSQPGAVQQIKTSVPRRL
jgi:hypothetical protein